MKLVGSFFSLALLGAIGPVAAETSNTAPACLAGIDPLIRQGQSAEALARLDACLDGHADDPQRLLLTGRALFAAQRMDEALAVFQRLAQTQPDSATAQNNLGVIHTKQGRLIDARIALEKAVELSPDFGTAHENLADIHVRLARLSYGLAVQSVQSVQSADEKASARVLHKLARISEPGNQASGNEKVLAKCLPAASVKVAEPTAVQTTPEGLKPEAPPSFGNPEKANTATDVKPAVTRVAPEILSQEAPSLPKGQPGEPAAVVHAVKTWAQAWSAGDFDAYLDFYDETFIPEGGKTRALWEVERRQRVARRRGIRVELSAIDVSALEPQSAEVRFIQAYTSSIHSDRGVKVLRLVQRGEAWKISRESFLPQSAPQAQR
ncbi:MAG: tetratricopeptide repeat protein [Burkholderiaceae bacterium]|nr:tetratricopeptide repeat protein [Burkholderiaceae bacterium]